MVNGQQKQRLLVGCADTKQPTSTPKGEKNIKRPEKGKGEKSMKTTTTLANCLVYNNRFATAKLTADQLGAEDFANWKTLVHNLHRASYAVYCECENSGLKHDDKTVNKSAIFDSVRFILQAIGEVNGHKMVANEQCAIALIGYAGRRANKDAPQLQLVNSQIANKKRELKIAEGMNGLQEGYIDGLKAELEKLEAQKAELLATADMRIKQPTMANESTFRLEVEHFLARTIAEQLAKTLEELDAEEEARKQARREKAKARKQAKAQAK